MLSHQLCFGGFFFSFNLKTCAKGILRPEDIARVRTEEVLLLGIYMHPGKGDDKTTTVTLESTILLVHVPAWPSSLTKISLPPPQSA